MERATEFFNKNEKNKVKWYELWKKKPKLSTMYSDNNHSQVIYLMSPENNFITFYDIGTDLNDLVNQVTEEISYDLGTRHIGTGKKPVTKI